MTATYVISLLSVAALAKTIHFYLKRNSDKKVSTEPRPDNQVLFFPDSNFPCIRLTSALGKCPGDENFTSLCNNPACRQLHNRPGERPSSLLKFLHHLAGARRKIDLCIFLFTQASLSDLLVDLRKRSEIQIRIITDSSENEADSSQMRRLRKEGIEIKSNKRGTGALMHHKFVIIDDETLLSGSFNWTNRAVVSNYEAVIVSKDPNLVEPFCDEFASLWNKFLTH